MQRYFPIPGILWLILLIFPSILLAQEIPAGTDGEQISILPQVTVNAERISPTTGMAIIDKEMIENLPERKGSINEIIGIVPGVQFSEDAFNSFTAGELTPPNVSISGSRYYDNNFTIDGVSNNSRLDAVTKITNDASKLPGHPQMQFLDSHLIEQITVYNSNIPAEFGEFTGGLVNAKIIEPTDYFYGNVNYRTTRDSWTKFYIDPANQNAFEHSTSEDMQPKFREEIGGLTLNIPLTENTAAVTSYQQSYSRIDLEHLGEAKHQTRKLENLLFKVAHQPNSSTQITFTSLYAPTSAEYFLKDFKNSDYQINDVGYYLSAQAEKNLASGKFEMKVGYNEEQIDRGAEKDRFFWDTTTPSIDWSTGKEGGLGRLESGQQDLSFKTDFSFAAQKLAEMEHLIKLGAEVTHSTQYYTRPETSYYYYSPVLYSSTPFTCSSGDPACIENEQYLSRRTVYYQGDINVKANNYAAYLEDTIVLGNLEISPGIRVSRDDITDDTHLAPRFSTSYDVFGNRGTVLFAGRNRYYSGTLLTYRLYQAINIENQVRTTPDNDASSWSSTPSYIYSNSNVKTPYTDEVDAGFIQKIFGGTFKFQYINKKSRDEFALTRESAPNRYLLNNNGRSEHDSYQAGWQRSWANHYFEINATRQETTTSNLDYYGRLDDANISSTVWFKGKELYFDELPRIDYNRPYIANLIYIGKLPYNFTFSNTTKFRGGYRRLKNTGQKKQSEVDPTQTSYIYETQRNKSSVVYDWRLSWKIPTFADNNAELTIDVLNVFNRKIPVSYYTDQFELGRQFWAGIDFNF